MKRFHALAEPWWVNLLLLVPVILFAAWRKQGLRLKWSQLAFLADFAVAFGLAEADVIIYLRAAVGMLPGYLGTLADVHNASYSYSYSQMRALHAIPQSLLKLETFREAATMAMLGGVALLSATKWRERCACFLWAFAIWDIVYYAGLRAVVHWPASWSEQDVLFLIPVPWIAQVWFPILVSALTLAVIARSNRAPVS